MATVSICGCECNCHDTLTATVIEENESLKLHIEELQNELHSWNVEIVILNEKNCLLNDLLTQHKQKYEALSSEYEKLQLYQTYNHVQSQEEIDKDDQIKQLQQQLNNSHRETTFIITANNNLQTENTKLAQRVDLLQKQLIERTELAKRAKADSETLRESMRIRLDQAMNEINEQNQQIDDLIERLCFNDCPSYPSIASCMKKTIKIDEISQLKQPTLCRTINNQTNPEFVTSGSFHLYFYSFRHSVLSTY